MRLSLPPVIEGVALTDMLLVETGEHDGASFLGNGSRIIGTVIGNNKDVNVLDVNYFREMNKTFDNGAVASTSYRNSKNYGSNWITAGYAVWFMREAKVLFISRK